jgi:hypothetical protein
MREVEITSAAMSSIPISEFTMAIPAWAWLLLVAALMATGFLSLARRSREINEQLDSGSEFRTKFIQYANSGGTDHEAYHWMILHSNAMQHEMGHHGILAHFRDPPFEYANYPIILNMIPRIRRVYGENLYFGNRDDLPRMFDEAMLRYIGMLEHSHTAAWKRLRNPWQWFLCGLEQIVSIPLYFFQSFGVLSRSAVVAAQRSRLFKFVSALVFLLGLAASLISILIDGRSAYHQVINWFST